MGEDRTVYTVEIRGVVGVAENAEGDVGNREYNQVVGITMQLLVDSNATDALLQFMALSLPSAPVNMHSALSKMNAAAWRECNNKGMGKHQVINDIQSARRGKACEANQLVVIDRQGRVPRLVIILPRELSQHKWRTLL